MEGIEKRTARLLFATVLSVTIATERTLADAFDELDAETATTNAQSQMSSRAQQAFDSLDEETRFGTRSQSEEQLDKEFQAWKLQYFAELKRYKKDILKVWDEAEITDKTTWVEYSQDYKTKKVIDYDKNEIRISVVQDKPARETLKVAALLEEMLATTPGVARKNDPVLAAVEPAGSVMTSPAENESLLSELAPEGEIDKQKQQQIAENLAQTASLAETKQSNTPIPTSVTTVTIKLPSEAILKRAQKYADFVEDYARRNKLDESIVYAVMHTESAFNPMARSNIPAFGLMQIVPESAGRDVSKKIYGGDQILSARFLYNPGNNIEVGSTYFNILYYNYLSKITDPESRLYCAIAAYNTGAGNVSVAFTGNRRLSKAVPIINTLTPQQVYNTLSEKLPYDETKTYLKRVVQRQQMYAQSDL